MMTMTIIISLVVVGFSASRIALRAYSTRTRKINRINVQVGPKTYQI